MKKPNGKGFTIIELVIVIAVIAILAAVLTPTFSGALDRANKSSALQEARSAWIDVSCAYISGYSGFAEDCGELNGWYYDAIDDIAKYTFEDKYTVTYDGEHFTVNDIDGSDRNWDAITASSDSISSDSPDFLTGDPFAFIVTYYNGIYTRGFSWMTDTTTQTGKLYLAQGALGADDSWDSAAELTVTSENHTVYYGHKAHTDTLSANTVYSYKAGTEGHWVYGTFKTEQEEVTSITAIQLSDAQTKDPTKLYVWENTLAQAVETAGHRLDMVLYNGDQFDSSMTTYTSLNRQLRYGVARDTVSDYLFALPYMSSSGNHEPAKDESYWVQVYNNEIAYGGTADSGAYYSYDYGFAHFVVLNTNEAESKSTQTTTASYGGKSFTVNTPLKAQAEWLMQDLSEAKENGAEWIVVTMHIGAYATGDHSNGTQVKNIITSFTPIFSAYHVDLVLQAHDHTYSKTLPYLWDSAGYTTTYDNTAVVRFNVPTTVYHGEEYDLNPGGTYYVTTGAAGHRVGASEGDAGIWADVTGTGTSGQLSPLYSGSTYLNNTYKIEVGKIKYSNQYTAFTCSSPSYTNGQVYNMGDPATGNVNAQMFGVLNLTKSTLTYDFYTVEGNEVKLFDSLNVMKD